MFKTVYRISSTILVVWTLYVHIANAQTGCDLAAVNRCVLLLNSTTDTDILTEGISAIPPKDVLLKLCRARTSYKNCFAPLESQCSETVVFSMTFGIIDKTLTFLCVDSYDEILEHESCWNNTGVTDGTVACHTHQNEMIADLKNRSNTMHTTVLRHNWCSILENTSDCMTDVVADMCGPTPACIMQTMMTRALAGLANLMSCTPLPDCSYLSPLYNESTSTMAPIGQTDGPLDIGTQPETATTETNGGFRSSSVSVVDDVTMTILPSVNLGNSDRINTNNPGNGVVKEDYVASLILTGIVSMYFLSTV